MSNRIKGFISEWEGMEPQELYDRATDSIITNYNYAPHARDDYGVLDFNYFVPFNDIHVKLLHTSNQYLKAYLINEQLRGMGYDMKIFPKKVQMKWISKE